MSTTTTTGVIRAADRTRDIKYAVRDVVLVANEAKAAGRDMIYLNIGDPCPFGFRPPAHMIEAAHKAMLDNLNGYAPSIGVEEALRAIEADARRHGIDNIVHTYIGTGGSETIDMALTALLNPGENILSPAPGYPVYTAIEAKLGAVTNPYFLDEANAWQPDLDDIRRKVNDRTRALVLINPNNPTGSVCSRETLQQIIDIALEHNLVIFSDEIYDRLTFDGNKHISIASLSREASVITLNGLSKNYVVPGWRIGWGVISGNADRLAPWVDAIQKLGRARLCANYPEQFAIKPALEGPQDHIARMIPELVARRDACVNMLNDIPGISCVMPRGAFYIFPRLEIDVNDEEWTKGLIRETGVVVVPGTGFGQRPGTHHFRIVTLPPVDTLREACRRIADYMKKFTG